MPAPLTVFDKYEVIRRLATGGMGDIFLARQTGVAGFNRLVVLKSLRPEIVEQEELFAQFLNEARTAARLNHPNVVAIYDIDEYRGIYFMAMEHIKGVDLTALLGAAHRLQQRIPARVAASMVHHAALGLFHAHTAKDELGRWLGIVHRDVSPQNLMVRLDGLTKVVDFGIASVASTRRSDKVQGKLRYMSPEQLQGAALDARSDQFSLGVVLWELLAQRRLFSAGALQEVYRQIVIDEYPRPSAIRDGVPPELEALTMRMLEKDRNRRFADLQEVAAHLREVKDAGPGLAEEITGRFVTLLAGKRIEALSHNLTPEAVTISGLLDTADLLCLECGAKNPLRHRYCLQCGSPLAHRGTEDLRPAEERTPGRRGPAPRPQVPRTRPEGLAALIKSHAAGAVELLGAEQKKVAVVAALVHGRPKTAAVPGLARHELDQRVSLGFSAIAEAHAAIVERLDATETVLVIGAEGGATSNLARALAAACALADAARELQIELIAAVDEGEVELQARAGGRPIVQGPVMRDAVSLRDRAAATGAAGVYVASRLASRAELDAELAPLRAPSVEGSPIHHLLRVVRLRRERPAPTLPLVGRREELVRARGILTQARLGSRGAIAFVGEPGAGKTRLLEAVEEAARAQGFIAVRAGGADPRLAVEGGLLIHATREALRQLEPKDAAAAEKMSALGLEGGVGRRIAQLIEHGLDDVDPDTVSRAPALLVRALLALADLAPLCLIVDDLHDLGSEDRNFLSNLVGRGAGARVAVFGAADRGAVDLAELGLEPHALSTFSDEHLLALAHAVLEGPVPPLAAQLLLERAGGSPALVVQLARAMVDLGGIVRTSDGHPEATPALATLVLPDRWEQLLDLRLAQLSRPARDLVRVGAVAGVIFTLDLVAAALGLSDGGKAASLEVVRSGLCERASAGGELLCFAQPRVRALLLARLTPADRRRVHARLAALLRATADLEDPATLATLAEHELQGQLPSAAVTAVRAAIMLGASEAARGLFEASLGLLAAEKTPTDEHRAAAATIATEGVPVLAARSLERAEGAVDELGALVPAERRASALLARAEIRSRLGRPGDALDDLDQAAPGLAADPAGHARVCAARGAALESLGRLADAAAAFDEAVSLAERGGVAPGFLAEQANALGRIYFKMGRLDRALELFTVALDEATRDDRLGARAQALTNLAAIHGSEGRYPAALAALAEAQREAEAAGDPVGVARAHYNAGRVMLARDDRAAAHESFREARRIAATCGWREGEALATEALEALGLGS